LIIEKSAKTPARKASVDAAIGQCLGLDQKVWHQFQFAQTMAASSPNETNQLQSQLFLLEFVLKNPFALKMVLLMIQ
jgi:hypothetical protein